MKKLLLASVLAGCVSVSVQASDWGYGEHHGPDSWGEVSVICAQGKNQSPIDVTNAVKANLEALSVSYNGDVVALTNNGHSLQANVTGKNELTIDGVVFELKQFHFHTPSENLIQGKQYPLEAHFVHADKQGNLAVVSVMYEMKEENKELAQLSSVLPEEGDTEQLAKSFPVADMLPSTGSYYRFNGSLTTPPCTEGVRWFVLEETQSLSSAQEQKLNKVMGNNNRPVQALNARKVIVNK
ncbi:carbonic anhydrase [Vibrio albus]|uniref:Carbonic anhydrase n=1 Tax=Vibrio albus TaxID=2200953 RepID=A0A2U3BDV5_9VIBR|nr:carbonic anhydrase family protein [Vibrio albus]PWI34971.1 carbonic anhydrase [Vibrio albus]